LEEVALCALHDVLMEVVDSILLIVGNPQGIWDQQLWGRINSPSFSFLTYE
jgi:hypothetical protein